MTRFELWAPAAEHVDLDIEASARPMRRGARSGWWELDVPQAEAGTDYSFRLDGSVPLPDPRSRWQPAGVDGPSRVVDHDAFPWRDGAWAGFDLTDAVLYELHVGTFSPAGTFDGAIEALDHLVRLGIDAVELMPVAEFAGTRNWGYDGVHLFAPLHRYGGPDGLKRLVDACHDRGLGVVLDVVYNHLGPAGNHLPAFGPYMVQLDTSPWGEGFNLDGRGSDEVRRYLVDNALQWLRDYHLDGLRLDAVHAIRDASAVHLLEQLSDRVAGLELELGRPLWLIAESDLNDPRIIESPSVGGYGVHAQWADDFHHALHTTLTGERSGYYEDFEGVEDLARAMQTAWVRPGEYSPHRDRVHGRPHGGLPGWKFVVFAQNHDQVGNRAAGDRLGHSVDDDGLRVAAGLYLLSPFTPMVFQGEEWAASAPFQYFTDHDDELGRAVTEGRRREFASFGWRADDVPDPQDPATFERSKLDWGETTEPRHAAMLDWYRRCIALRRSPAFAELPRDHTSAVADTRSGSLVVFRGPVTIAANLGDQPVDLVLADRPAHELLASGPGSSIDHDRQILRLAASTLVVLGN